MSTDIQAPLDQKEEKIPQTTQTQLEDTQKENETKSSSILPVIKDFEVIEELQSINPNIKSYKVIRKFDKKEYTLLFYSLKLFGSENNIFQKLEKTTDLIKLFLLKINTVNVINIKESFIDHTKNAIIIVLENFLSNKTLYSEIILKYKKMKDKYIPENVLLKYIKQIATALFSLHNNYVFNINLSPENIIFTENSVIKLNPYSNLDTISDFTKCNNNYYKLTAPELLKNSNFYTSKTDIWYLGLLIYELSQLTPLEILSKNIFENENNEDDIYTNIIRGKYFFNDYYSNNIKELIKLCLQYSAKRRPNPREILTLIGIYLKNMDINEKVKEFNITHHKLKIKKNLKEEIEKFNSTLSKIQKYENKNYIRNLTPFNERNNNLKKFKSLVYVNKNVCHKITRYDKVDLNKPKLKIKNCFVNDKSNSNNFNKTSNFIHTGKKFFNIRKNCETLKGYMQIPQRTDYYNLENIIGNLRTTTPIGRTIKIDNHIDNGNIVYTQKKNIAQNKSCTNIFKNKNKNESVVNCKEKTKVFYKSIKIVSTLKKKSKTAKEANKLSKSVNLLTNKIKIEAKNNQNNNNVNLSQNLNKVSVEKNNI